jgi:hypothetical protein
VSPTCAATDFSVTVPVFFPGSVVLLADFIR